MSATTAATSAVPAPRAAAPDRRLRAGVIGLGKQAVDDHIPGLLGADRAKLVAVCDNDAMTAQTISRNHDVPGYRDYREMLRDEDLDLVIVTVPHHVGRDAITAATEAGVHVLKEKPFATSLTEATELAQVCAVSGVELMVTLQRRFNPIYTTFTQLADQIGTPIVIDAQYTLHVEDPSAGWRGQSATAGGGCVIDMGYHLIDMILWYFGPPDGILCELSATARPDRRYDAEDTALIHFRYDHGLYGSLLVSRFIGPKTEHIRLVGTKGIVHLERGRVQRLTNGGQPIETLIREQSWPAAAASQIDHFCRVIAGERPNLSSPADNLAHMAFIAACYSSARNHRYVNPKEML